MKELRDKVAVVTGGASGIGRALGAALAREGMRIVLADVESEPLARATEELTRARTRAIGVQADVSKADEVAKIATAACDAFGGVHVVCNNAGVALSGLSWTHTLADWEWLFGVNLWGVIHGVRTFVPLMLAQGDEGHVVNTASMAGLVSGPGMAVYNVTKHGVVTLSETLYQELRALGAAIGVSVLCPGWVNTNILDSARNRPAALADTAPPIPGRDEMEQAVRALLAVGLPPETVAARVVDAIRADRFYVLPHPDWKRLVRARMEDILEDRNPSPSIVEELAVLPAQGGGQR